MQDTPIGLESYLLPCGPLSTAEDRARFWQSQRPPRSHDAWSEGYGTPSTSSDRTDPLTVVPAGPPPMRPQAVVARHLGPVPNPLPSYGPFTVPSGGLQSRSWERVLFNGPRHPGFRPWHSLILAHLFDQTLGPAPPPGAILNNSATGPAWFPAPPEPTVTYLYPCTCDNRDCRCACLPLNRPCSCPFPRRSFSL